MSDAASIPVVLKTDSAHGPAWHAIFAEEAPDLTLADWDEAADLSATRYLVAWRPPADIMRRMPRLEAVFSMGAGIDHLPLEHIPQDVVVVRMVADDVTRSMAEYVTMGVLALHRDLPAYLGETRRGVWATRSIRRARDRVVGILGLGVLGRAAAERIALLGFQTRGWSRSRKDIANVCCHAGDAGLGAFLDGCEIVVCMLPLTPETRGILNGDLFARLPRGAKILNAGRGGHLVEADLLAALESGRIDSAMLDVLNEEPPAPSHPLLTHPRVLVTPHTASASQPDDAARQVIAAIRNHRSGRPIEHTIDRQRGF
ncbi:glyoxylate/hydroxypyruvate reductase A [Rhodobium orientis]|uniref:Glyoxylate/hydroxypyruvate reductase A n=1 Tax=Rhodobium orientis TaxID=34017 RepID=A0A327JWA6_9HYPH|nr:glyoxylate/hydroxypyruvate reductase A [Rhodobium orientis]MBB4302801.1 glyoxylate/hydroxypyruvate reductase A [Rhodobium orientis]MBK5948581.1 glyoxylate/hydroxypyruvate reductase A [Rhodobium orientis]RAI29844.1 glyoxylate/hydroxypyruvate reductase A [Rhodobium orientis]